MGAGAHIAWFDEIGLGDREQVGGKGGSLGELTRAGIAVPPGYVVRTSAFERFLESLEREAPVRSEEHTSELQSPCNLVCRLLLEKKKILLHYILLN